MKLIDNILCASQASTAVCLSIDHMATTQSSSSSSSAATAPGRAIDRHNPIIRESKRLTKPPCSSLQPRPITPRPLYHQLPKAEKHSTDDKGHAKKKKSFSATEGRTGGGDGGRKSVSSLFKLLSDDIGAAARRSSCEKPACGLTTPPGSSRYLLGEGETSPDRVVDCDPVSKIVNDSDANGDTFGAPSKSDLPSLPEKEPSSDQVVVLRVSLHCKGCEGKVRKHLSKMQGVTSFNIDFVAKKVTVTGDVTPLGVLASISKVKNAQFWTPPKSSSSSSERADPEIKRQCRA